MPCFIPVCRLLKFPLSDRYPSVQRLSVHDKDDQEVYLWDDGDIAGQVQSEKAQRSTLTEYFRLNQEDAIGLGGVRARSLLYSEITGFFRWVNKKFVRRKVSSDCVSRLDFSTPKDGERFYIRLLLSHVRGATSFINLRTVDGQLCPTFRQAADKLGLLESDVHFDKCLSEAGLWMSGAALRNLFGLILVHNSPSDPEALWIKHRINLQDDCAYKLQKGGRIRIFTPEQLDMYCLHLIRLIVENMGSTLTQCGITIYNDELANHVLSATNAEVPCTSFCAAASREVVYNQIPLLNQEQLTIFSTIRDQYNKGEQELLYIDGPGGTGKTFLLNTILHYFNSRSIPFISVASSGVAAQLLLGGTTAHSAFGIPLEISQNSMCSLSGRDKRSRRLQEAHVMVWDEASMAHRFAVECVDKALRHLRQNDSFFGGISVYFSGDFRQTLPIVPDEDYTAQAYACLKWSSIWNVLNIYQLIVNVRLLGAEEECSEEAQAFANWLLYLGTGRLQETDKSIIQIQYITINDIPSNSNFDIDTINWLYDGLQTVLISQDWNRIGSYYSGRCLITTLNKTVDSVNRLLNDTIVGDSMISISMDFRDEDEVEPLGEDFLNSIELPGFSRHRLQIKKGLPVMLIRNLNVGEGLCNGTRMVISDFSERVLKCRLISGSNSGQDILLPKIKLIHDANRVAPIKFSRFQFPIVEAFCLTINKAQGQTLDRVGVLLPEPIFAHGQLYVALSRCRDSHNIRIALPLTSHVGETTNVTLRRVVEDEC